MRLDELEVLGKTLGIRVYTIRDLVDYRLRTEPAGKNWRPPAYPRSLENFSSTYRPRHGHVNDNYLALTLGQDQFGDRVPWFAFTPSGLWSTFWASSLLLVAPVSTPPWAVADEGCGVVLFLRHSPTPHTSSPSQN